MSAGLAGAMAVTKKEVVTAVANAVALAAAKVAAALALGDESSEGCSLWQSHKHRLSMWNFVRIHS